MTQARAALVTGGSRGIGAAIARRLGASGADVAVNYRSDAGSAAAVVADIQQAGRRATAIGGDVTDHDQVGELFTAAEQALGPLDVVVHNVGAWGYAPLSEATDEHFAAVFEANTRSGFAVLREAANRVADGGRIVVISSGTTTLTPAGLGLYAASKAALDTMVKVLAKELGPRHITVNSVAPGGTRTDGLAQTLPPQAYEQMVEQVVAGTPLGRIGEPDDIADVVDFLTSHAGRWITGQSIAAGGGQF